MENENMNPSTVDAQEVDPTQETKAPAEQSDTSELDQLKADLEKERAERKAEQQAAKKNKEALDKALHDVAKLTKERRAEMTDAQREAAEREEKWNALVDENEELKRYKQTNMAKERYLLRGMSPELAAKAAEAEVSGNMEELSNIEQQYHDLEMKAAEAEWKKSRPRMNAGDGSASMTREEIMAIQDPVARREAIARNIDQF